MITRDRLDRLGLMLALFVLAHWCAYEITRAWTNFPPDLSALYAAGWLFGDGQTNLIYAAPPGFFGGMPPEWASLTEMMGMAGQEPLPYVYPPLWAALMAPLTGALSPEGFFRTMALVQLPMLPGCAVLAWRMLRPNRLPLWAWLGITAALLWTSLIVSSAVVQLQPQITVAFLTLLAFERYGAGRVAAAGALLALAAALKLAPAGLALIFLLDRNWRALGWFAGVGATLAGLSLILAGPALHFEFLARLSTVSGGVFLSTINFSADSLIYAAGVASGLIEGGPLSGHNLRITEVPAAVSLISKALLIAAIAVLYLRSATLPDGQRLPVRLVGLSLLLNIFGPLGWAHYFLPQLFFLPALLTLRAPIPGLAALVGLGAATSLPLFLTQWRGSADSLPFVAAGGALALLYFTLLIAPRAALPAKAPLPRPA